jgi:hypothetical protein
LRSHCACRVAVPAQCDRLIRLRDGAVIDDIALSDGYPADEVLRRVGQLG